MTKWPREQAGVITTLGFAAILLVTVYLPDVGHGFIKDDFGWLNTAARLGDRPWMALFSDATGTFYRPMITLTFALDHAVHGLEPFGYGLTNLLLLVACAAVGGLLLRQLGFTAAAAATAVSLWIVNPHGINMSVLWLSGRTSLVMTLLSCAATIAFIRGVATTKPSPAWVAAGWLLLLGAMLSKEDALLVPVAIATALWALGTSRQRLGVSLGVMLTVVAAYLALRLPSHALNPQTAPDFYRLTWNPLQILENGLGYLDRSATLFVVASVVLLLASGNRPTLSAAQRRFLWLALAWFIAGIAITYGCRCARASTPSSRRSAPRSRSPRGSTRCARPTVRTAVSSR